MKITCLIDALNLGGAQRAALLLLEGLSSRGHEITLTTFDPAMPDFYRLKPGINRVKLPVEPGICRWFDLRCQTRRFRALKACVSAQAPDLIISFIDTANVLTLAAFPSGRPPVIVCEQVNPLHWRIGPHWSLLRRALYPLSAAVVMLTEDTARWAASLRPGWPAVHIPNPVVPPVYSENISRPAFFGQDRNLVALGRLHEQKGFDMLITAFASVAGRFPRWQLTIIGEGPERKNLESLIRGSGLSGRVALPGVSEKPSDALRYADLFVMSSRYEGFGMVLAEAMACGLPAVSFDCPSGPGSMIRHGVDGLLVRPGDVAGLGSALAELMGDEEKRVRMASRASEIVERFSYGKYLDDWEKLIRSAVG
ncbi:MAG TPA: glycosyltransferase family 4 protein [Elusimicrobiales bacterium]|nr:glycosyltransferase family 4 protein [Elusimicrobiales bacterium]